VESVKAEAKRLMQAGEFHSIENLTLPDDIKGIFITSGEISPENHVKMQAAFQEYVDSGISKTINFPEQATPADVDQAFRLAIESGCKGLTFYRLGSRKEEVLTTRRKKEE
jgi:ribonucleoside-diphosphate reductase alpha chain